VPDVAARLKWAFSIAVVTGLLVPVAMGKWTWLISLGLFLAAWIVAAGFVNLYEQVGRLGASGGSVLGRMRTLPRGQAHATEPLGHDQRPDLADARRQRRQIGACLQLPADLAHHEPVRVTAQLLQLARQQMAFARVRGNQLIQRLGVSLGAGSD